MAINNLEDYKQTAGFDMSLNIRRGNPNPLDNSSVWPSLTKAENYAKNDTTAYVGQILTVVENGISTPYVINDTEGKLAPIEIHKTVPTNQKSAEGVRYYKLLTITPTGLAHGDMFYEFFVSARSNENTTIRIAASTTDADKLLGNVSITYDGNLHTYITAYRFREVIDNVSTDRIELWGELSSWNMWDIFQKTYDRHKNISLTWNIEQADALPTNAYENIEITALSWLGNAATATKATQDASGNIFTDYYATISSLNELRNELVDIDGLEEALKNKVEGSSISADIPHTSTGGWYRIAQSSKNINNCIGTFEIVGKGTGNHSMIILSAGISYGYNSDINVLYSGHFYDRAFDKARIVYNSTYENNYAYLEIYASPINSKLISTSIKLIGGTGWTLVDPSTPGEIPSGYMSKEVMLPRDGVLDIPVVENYLEYANLTASAGTKDLPKGALFSVCADLYVKTGYYKVTNTNSAYTKYDLDSTNHGSKQYINLVTPLIEKKSDGTSTVLIDSGVYSTSEWPTIRTRTIRFTASDYDSYDSIVSKFGDDTKIAIGDIVHVSADDITYNGTDIQKGYYYYSSSALHKISDVNTFFSYSQSQNAYLPEITVGSTTKVSPGLYSMNVENGALVSINQISIKYRFNTTARFLEFIRGSNATTGTFFEIYLNLAETNIRAGLYYVNYNNKIVSASFDMRTISAAPTDTNVSYPVTVSDSDLEIGDVTFPAYSKGLFVSGDGDATLQAVSPAGELYAAYRNGSTWTAKKVSGSSSGSSSSNTTTLSSLGITVSATSINDGINYLKDVTSNVQTQLNNKLTYTADTTDIGSGSSLETGKLYLVIE